MADITKNYLDYAKLQEYDTAIKGQILSDAANAAAAAVAALDTSSDVTIASQSGKAVTIAAGISETDGIVGAGSGSAITLADVASTGNAEDVAYDNTTSGLNATDLQAAVDEVAAASAGGVSSKTVYMVDNGASSDYAKVYNLYQGDQGSSSSPVAAELIGTINIPKDKVVEDGSVVNIVFKASDSTLHEGSESGTDVTELIVGPSGTATSADAGKYIKLILQNVTDPLYIAAQSLVDIYTTEQSASEVQLTIDSNNEISAAIVAVAATKVTHGNSTVEAALNTLEGDATTAGSVAKAEADAKAYADGLIAALDTSSDVALYSHDSTTGAVTFTGSLAEADGVIAEGTADDVIFTPITSAQIQALFA